MPRLFGGIHLLDRPSPANILRVDLLSLPLISQMQSNGIYLNPTALSQLSNELALKLSTLNSQIQSHCHSQFNPASPDQVANLLFQDLHLEPPASTRKTPTGKRLTVDDDTLSAMVDQHPVIQLLREWREAGKLKSTYVDALPLMVGADGRIHTTFRNTQARTGRLTSEAPNLQNIPQRTEEGRRVRGAFQSDPRYRGNTILASIDLSQIEMVVAAHLSQDHSMMDVFWTGKDIHLKTVCGVFGYDYSLLEVNWKKHKKGKLEGPEEEEMRSIEMDKRLPLKQVSFGVLFGQSPVGVQMSILGTGGPFIPVDKCEGYIEDWFGVYPKVRDWMNIQHQRARRYGMVWTICGRSRLIPGVKSALRGVVNEALRQCVNTPIQGSAADILKVGIAEITPLVEYFQGFKDEVCLPLLQVHDELIFELSMGIKDDFLGMAKPLIETAVPLSVPVRSSMATGNSWQDLK